ncbi:MAG: ATP-binding cassette domain-containing protein [Clostridia bacterium]|nr:ATP-binding cassette domain-containing protein [Clostridia bacterium]
MIDFINVRKVYPNGTVALENINLHIDEGEFVFLVGPSGAGKSTILKLLLREEKATSGKVLVRRPGSKEEDVERKKYFNLGRIPSYRVPLYRRQLGIVFQDFRLFEKKTVYENVAFAMQVIGTPNAQIKTRVPAILATVNLDQKIKNYPNELSGGEQQRVALARALANNPQIVFADEPTANIDQKLGGDIITLLERINRRFKKTVIVITHDMNIVNARRHRVISIADGQIVSDTRPEELSGE